MDNTLRKQIEAIHSTNAGFVLAITGGGTSAIGQLLVVPGGSQTLLEARVPYSPQSLTSWLHAVPDQSCSEPAARAMGMAAYQRAAELSVDQSKAVVGLGATAALGTNRPKRGAHRVHVAWQTKCTTASVSLELTKGARTRDEEEEIAARLILVGMSEAVGLEPFGETPLLKGEEILRRQVNAPAPWQALLAGQIDTLPFGALAERDTVGSKAVPVLFPGAFNPLHEAHLQMAAIAEQQLGRPVAFEITVANVDKPPLDFVEMQNRTSQFSEQRLVLTRAATFVEKARLFPGVTFVVGGDTIARIAQAKYYGGETERDAAIEELAELRCAFLVFGRQAGNKFLTLERLGLPPALRAICQAVPESEFRNDLSSTRLRQGSVES